MDNRACIRCLLSDECVERYKEDRPPCAPLSKEAQSIAKDAVLASEAYSGKSKLAFIAGIEWYKNHSIKRDLNED